MVCFQVIRSQTFLQAFILRTLLCGAMCFFLYQISGDKTLTSSYNYTGYVIKVAAGFWVFALPVGIVSLVAASGDKYPMWDNLVVQTVIVFLMFLFVGLFEELTFRAIINDAIIYKFRDKKYVFVLSAVVSSLVFGAVAVIIILALGRFAPQKAIASIDNPVLRGSAMTLFRVLIPAHIFFGAVMGYYYGLAKKTGKTKYHVLSVLIPILLHTIYDTPIAIITIIDSPDANGRYEAYQVPVVLVWAVVTIIFVVLTIITFVRIKKGAKNSKLQEPIFAQ